MKKRSSGPALTARARTTVLDLLSNAASIVATYFIFSAYCALSPERKGSGEGPVPSNQEKVGFLLACALAVTLMLTGHPQVARVMAGLLAGVCSSLVIGRFANLGAPRKVTAVLYLGAMVHFAYSAAPPDHAAIFFHLRLPLDLLLFLVITWSIRGLAAERFLLGRERFLAALPTPSSLSPLARTSDEH